MTILKNLRNNGTSIKMKGQGRLIFMALIPEIEEALDAGYMVVDIWRLLTDENRLEIHYATFNGYVKKYIRNKPSKAVLIDPSTSSEPRHKNTEQSTSPDRVIPGLTKPKPLGFEMDPDVRTSGIRDLLK